MSYHIDGTGINRDANNDVYTGLLSTREALLSYMDKRQSGSVRSVFSGATVAMPFIQIRNMRT